MKGLIDFTNNCKLWTSSITNPNYNMLSNNLQQYLNFPGFVYNNFTIGPLNKTLQIPFMYYAKEELLNEIDEISDAWHIGMFEHDAA